VSDQELLTAADIARLAGVTRATVSNWRRRHPDFPRQSGGTDASPAYDRDQVESWLAARGSLPELTLDERVWRAVRAASAGEAGLGASVQRVAEMLASFAEINGPAAHMAMKSTGFPEDLAETVREYGRQAATEALIGRYLESPATRSTGTPQSVARLMATLADAAGATVYDPAAGAGDLLVAAVERGAVQVTGQEVDPTLIGLLPMRFADDVRPREIAMRPGNALLGKGFGAQQADVVLCHPPFGDKDWGYEELANDPRWEYGTPPRSEPELAWVQVALSNLRPGGRAVLLMPPAAASRPAGRRIRAELVRRGALRAIIGLPAGAVRPRHIPVHIWVLARPGEEGVADPQMLFADSSELGDWTVLEHKVQHAWESFRDKGAGSPGQPGVWRVVPGIELLDEAVDLTPQRHVGEEAGTWAPVAVLAESAGLRRSLTELLAEMADKLPGGDMLAAKNRKRWRTATIADLGRWEMVTFHRASSSSAPSDTDLAEDPEDASGLPVLTLKDVLLDRPPSGILACEPSQEWFLIQAGDVIVPVVAAGSLAARVASREDEVLLGRNLQVVRPVPDRMDPWFLSGFLLRPSNVKQASYGSVTTKIDVRKLAVPVLPAAEQRAFGEAFRELREFESASAELSRQATRLTGLLRRGLADGSLQLPGETSQGGSGAT
jgi:hypothetical protein